MTWADVSWAERFGGLDSFAKLLRAVEQGEKSPEVFRRLMALLAAKGRFAEANAVLNDLPWQHILVLTRDDAP